MVSLFERRIPVFDDWRERYNMNNLVGAKIQQIFMDFDVLTFITDKGNFSYGVTADCCSSSYFYDFHGVQKLLENGPVVSTRSIDLEDPDDEDARRGDVVVAYGFEIVTEHPKWGEQTSVVSFRNDSNGYYGGSLVRINVSCWDPRRELFTDCLEVKELPLNEAA